jgi:hypothetical protein
MASICHTCFAFYTEWWNAISWNPAEVIPAFVRPIVNDLAVRRVELTCF